MSTPAQIQALIEKYTAPDAAENCTIGQAQQFAAYMQAVGMPFDALVAQQTGGQPADTATVDSLLTKGVPANVPLLLVGQNNQMSPDGPTGDPVVIGHTIALERAILAGTDGANGYIRLYVERHVGATNATALAAAAQLPATADAIPQVLEQLKSKSGV